jgi:N-acetylmuramoyl-L-alanine amidase
MTRRNLILVVVLGFCAYLVFGFAWLLLYRPASEPQTYGPDWQRRLVVLDPGHGGDDPGTIAASGTLEKDVNLRYATELMQHLKATGRYTVVLTREDDDSVGLKARVAVATRHEADAFISIHGNAPYTWNRGYMIICSDRCRKPMESAALAKCLGRNLKAAGFTPDLLAGFPPPLIRATSWVRACICGKPFDYMLRNQGLGMFSNTRARGLTVLDDATVPAVLIEVGYLTNPSEEARIRSADVMEEFCAAVKRGLGEYFRNEDNTQ